MKKLEPLEALAKIKIKIKRYHESVGIGSVGEYDYEFGIDAKRIELIEKIDDILRRVKIPAKNLIVEEFDEEVKPIKENDNDNDNMGDIYV